jgi:hypothetical protein
LPGAENFGELLGLRREPIRRNTMANCPLVHGEGLV